MAKEFKVESISLKTKLTNEGQFIDVYEIKFVTKSGIRSKIEVPKDQFKKEDVEKYLSDEVTKLESIYNL